MPMCASTLYSVDVKLPIFFMNFCEDMSSISALLKELSLPEIVLAVPILLLTIR